MDEYYGSFRKPPHPDGIHKHRFDKNGRGRGISGRERKVVYDGNTESSTRCHETLYEVDKILKKPARKPVVTPDSKVVEQARCIWVYRNGDRHHEGHPVYIKRHITNLAQLHQEVSKFVSPLTGAVRKLYDQNLQLVRDLDDFVDGAKYLCCGGEQPDLQRLENFLSP